MSHTVNITRRITTTTSVRTSNMGMNTDYFKKIPGILLIAETVLGAIVIGLTTGSAGGYSWFCLGREIFLFVISIACFITTFLMFMSYLCHQSTADSMPKTLFGLLYNGVACVLYLAGAIVVLVDINRYGWNNDTRYNELLTSGIFAIIVGILYLVSTMISYKSFKE